MHILVVSSYPPTRCGIGRYAANQVQRLRTEGHTVEVMSLDGEGEVEHVVDWTDPADRREAFARFQDYDRVIVHYGTGLLPSGDDDRAAFHRALAATMDRARGTEIVVHEVEYHQPSRNHRRLHQFWRAAPAIVFHTATERDRFLACYPKVAPDRTRLVAADALVYRWYHGTRASARAELGIPADRIVFVSAGFLQHTKGFDRVVPIFETATDLHSAAYYYVVGSARVAEHAAYVAALHEAAGSTDRVTVREGFLEDEDFDRWLAASDIVVLPYRQIWSSAVLARAQAYGRPVIATDVGGLRDQAGSADVIVADDDELRAAVVAASWRVPAPSGSR